MEQVATFLVPQEQDKCNEFLRVHKPSNINFNKDTVIIFYDNGEESSEHKIADLREFIKGAEAAQFQQEVAVYVAQTQLADLQEEKRGLNFKHNKERYEQVDALIANIKAGIDTALQAIAIQGIKVDFVKARIANLQNVNE